MNRNSLRVAVFVGGLLVVLSMSLLVYADLIPLALPGFLLGLVLLAAGLAFWWPARTNPEDRSKFGSALLVAAGVSLASSLVAVQQDLTEDRRESRATQLEARRTEQQRLNRLVERPGLLQNLDVGERDLVGLFLPQRKVRNVTFARANLVRSNWQGADVAFSSFIGADLSMASLRHAVIRFSSFQEARLNGADLSGTDLRGTDFGSAIFGNANLSHADLRFVSLRGADLRYARFEDTAVGGAAADPCTSWPSGIDPARAGVALWTTCLDDGPRGDLPAPFAAAGLPPEPLSQPGQPGQPGRSGAECSVAYAGGCVPVEGTSDVDCRDLVITPIIRLDPTAGPRTDPYGLDPSGDGIACES